MPRARKKRKPCEQPGVGENSSSPEEKRRSGPADLFLSLEEGWDQIFSAFRRSAYSSRGGYQRKQEVRSLRAVPKKGGIAVDGKQRVSTAAMLLALALLPISPASLPAQEGGHQAEEGGHHLNHAGLFLGVTRLEGHSSFTIGADYERTLPVAHERVAIGALIDAAIGPEPKHVIVAGTLSFRPVEPLKLVVGPGVEFSHGKREALFRAGASVDLLHAGPFTISPGVYFDFVGGHTATVFGVTFGKGF